jgi:cytochrome bd ubiquinol oxidase subunit II
MTEIIIGILGIAILLYVLLGGADFGAGIVEWITGKKGIKTISQAIAPVWEANHIWIILAVVILFNGFPLVYTRITTYLHIPLLIILLGIIIRGSAFTFRYYDAPHETGNQYYSFLFRFSSLLTPFFLGIVLGAVMLGKIPENAEGTFYNVFMAPWLNGFSIATGLFLTLLFGWIASVYLIGEATDETYPLFARTSIVLFTLLITGGLIVFLAAHFYQLHFLQKFLHSYVSMGSMILATLLVPIMWIQIKRKNALWTRILAGIITACILTGWFAVQFPVMVYISGGQHLTVWNARAPDKTMHYLLIALIAGIVLIFPAFAYLFKVFKFRDEGLGTRDKKRDERGEMRDER